MKISSLLVISLAVASVGYAAGSDSLGPPAGLVPHGLQSYVDTKNCTAPIQSSPYIIVAGNGGANMKLVCPSNYPVMYGWRQQVGFVGALAVSTGGGRSWITCCAVGQKWAVAKTGQVS